MHVQPGCAQATFIPYFSFYHSANHSLLTPRTRAHRPSTAMTTCFPSTCSIPRVAASTTTHLLHGSLALSLHPSMHLKNSNTHMSCIYSFHSLTCLSTVSFSLARTYMNLSLLVAAKPLMQHIFTGSTVFGVFVLLLALNLILSNSRGVVSINATAVRYENHESFRPPLPSAPTLPAVRLTLVQST